MGQNEFNSIQYAVHILHWHRKRNLVRHRHHVGHLHRQDYAINTDDHNDNQVSLSIIEKQK